MLATSAHAAFAKAAHYFGVKAVRVSVRDDFRVDVDAMAAAVNDHTVLVVGSAPQYPQGVVDPIEDIAALALDAGVLCHVDACMGGFVLPFLVKAGKPIPPFDFRVPGVTSMSADVHKYGYANKGVSVVLYRDEALRKRQAFVFSDWLGGFYASSGVAGSKPTSPYAAAWAVLHYIGEEGYIRLATEAYDGRIALEQGVRAIPGLTVVGSPESTLCAIAASDPEALDIFLVGDELRKAGLVLRPAGSAREPARDRPGGERKADRRAPRRRCRGRRRRRRPPHRRPFHRIRLPRVTHAPSSFSLVRLSSHTDENRTNAGVVGGSGEVLDRLRVVVVVTGMVVVGTPTVAAGGEEGDEPGRARE